MGDAAALAARAGVTERAPAGATSPPIIAASTPTSEPAIRIRRMPSLVIRASRAAEYKWVSSRLDTADGKRGVPRLRRFHVEPGGLQEPKQLRSRVPGPPAPSGHPPLHAPERPSGHAR